MHQDGCLSEGSFEGLECLGVVRMLGVSPLHYSTGSQDLEGVKTVASACALCQPVMFRNTLEIILTNPNCPQHYGTQYNDLDSQSAVLYHCTSGWICHAPGQDPSHSDNDITQYIQQGLL